MRIVSFGEIMMRLTPPDYLLLEQTNQLTLSFVGTGVNLLSSLSRFGHKTAIMTKVPDNSLGRAAVAEIRKLGIQDDLIGYSGNHLGSFFVELGFDIRPTVVTYQNRLNSSFCSSAKETYDFASAVKAADIVHICGIALSLTKETRESAIALAKIAKEQGKLICFDFNYRPSLNQENEVNKIRSYYEEILQYSDMVFGSYRDLTELLGLVVDSSLSAQEQLLQVSKEFMEKYQIQQFSGTIRKHGKEKELTGFIMAGEHIYISDSIALTYLDRIGSGDAYAAGIINGYIKNWSKDRTVNFATANAALAHITRGDTPMATQQQVEQFMYNPTIDLIR